MTQLSSTWSRLFLALLSTLIGLAPHIHGQTSYGCPIFIDSNSKELSSFTAGPGVVTNMMSGGVHFGGLSNLYGRDSKTADITLDHRNTSALLYASDFGLAIPTGAHITGVEVIVTADVTVPSAIKDVRIGLASGPNQAVGNDKANLSLGGRPWGTDARWHYGSVLDMWGTSLDYNMVNSSSFGVLLQISNRADTTVTAFLDQLALKVYYQPVLQLCGHPCIALSAPVDEEVVSYSWNVQGELVAEASDQLDHVVNIFAEQSPFGEYEVCLTRRFADGQTDNCCRPIHYDDCSEGSIGDRIWEDTNGNGIQDPGEPDMGACTVRLYDASFNFLASTVSANGRYLFDGLQKGQYVVAIDTKGYSSTININSDPQNNSDLSNLYIAGSTGVIDLAAGEHRRDIDFGLVEFGGICGHTWRDINGDGLETVTDVAVPGIRVNLYDSSCNLLNTTVTDGAGNYCFECLPEADYLIDYELPDGCIAGGYGTQNIIDPLTGKISVNLSYGEYSFGNDLSVYKGSSIGNRAWADENQNGIQDPGEPGLEGVVLNLFDCADVYIQSVTSTIDGAYTFVGIRPGEYYICVESAPFGYAPTIMVSDPGVDSSLGTNGCTDCMQLMDDTHLVDIDLGFIFSISNIGDQVWFDENENGVFDPGEEGLPDVTLHLQDCNDNVVQTQVTDANGQYLFSDVPAGDYVICIDEDYRDYRNGSSLLVSGDCTACFMHSGSADITDLDFNLIYEKATADTKVWLDENGNGIREDFEPLIEGVITEFYTCDNQLIGQDLTDEIGGAWFADVCAGNYYFKIILPEGYEFITNGGQITGANGPGTSDCFSVLGFGRTINVGLTQVDMVSPTVCATVWNDINENNVLEAGENPLSNIQIDIFNCIGLFVGSIDADGTSEVCLEDLEIGDYYISVMLPEGYSPAANSFIDGSSGPGTSMCFFVDREVEISIGVIENIEEQLPRLDAVLFEDLDQDGVHDTNEPLFSNLSADLYQCNGTLIGAMSTDNLGSVWYNDVPAGDYYLVVQGQEGYSFTSGGEITETNGTGSTDCFSLSGAGRTVNAGYVRNPAPLVADISGKIWYDANGNGMMDDDEVGMNKVLVRLYDENFNLIEENYSDSNGLYLFADLVAADYFLQFESLDGYEYTQYRAGGNSGIDSEVADFNLGMTGRITFSAIADMDDVNAGLILRQDDDGSIGGRVWVDLNNNNIEDIGEVGYEELLVVLYDDSGSTLGTTFTDKDGTYNFPNLREGSYIIDFELPEGFQYSTAYAGTDEELDSHVIDYNEGRTAVISLGQSAAENHINAGLQRTQLDYASVAGTVWVDANADGYIDTDEDGLSGNFVIMYDSNNNLYAQTVTNGDGQYKFENVLVGSYYLQFQPYGIGFTSPKIGNNSDVDSEVTNASNGTTDIYVLSPGQELIGINAGVLEVIDLPSSEIRGRVWLDADEDGIIGAEENGLENITVSLIDDTNTQVAATSTNSDGYYTFANLEAGLYYLSFEKGTYLFSDPQVGGTADNDSEVINTFDGFTGLYILREGEDLSHINAGLYSETTNAPRSSISGQVWLDADKNGVISGSESGIENIVVKLVDDTNTELAQITTDADGSYTFAGLDAGLYYLSFDKGSYSFSDPQVGGTADNDSEVLNTFRGFTRLYILSEGEDLKFINAGLYEEITTEPSATISGQVWFDEDQSGVIDNGEVGIENIVIRLLDDTDTEISQTLTDINGNYTFFNLESGLYYLNVEKSNYTFVTPNAGGTSDLDSEVVNTSMGYTILYMLNDGQNLTGINAGLYREPNDVASITGLVWDDADRDGLIGDQESGMENIQVSLYDMDQMIVEQQLTDVDGRYTFINVVPDLYYLTFDKPEDFKHTTPKAGVNSLIDSEVVNFNNTNTVVYVLASGELLEGINAGFYKPIVPVDTEGLLGGQVWEDLNGNGMLDAGEPLTESVLVLLKNSQGSSIGVKRTEVDGSYTFGPLTEGDYSLEFMLPLDSKATKQDTGNDESLDSDIDVETMVAEVSFNGTDQTGVNAGYYYPASIGDFVWLDINSDGIQDLDELGANNYIINLYDGDNNYIAREWSSFDDNGVAGKYQFTDLAPGDYIVKVTTQQGIAFSPTQATDSDNDSDITNSNGIGSTDVISLVSGTQIDDIDIGLVLAPATLGDRLWLDENGDGVQDDGEPGINDVTVILFNVNDDIIGTTTTANVDGEDGIYRFEDLYPTEYYVKFDFSDRYVLTTPDVGGVDSKDSDIDNSNGEGTTSIFLLSPGETDLDIDGGLFLDAYIGDKVWHDRDKDGVQDNNEPGVEDVEIELYRITNSGDQLVETTLTDALGEYRFGNISNGDYYLIFYPQDDFEMTDPGIGGDETTDSDASKNGVTDIITITNSTSNATIDVGLIRPDNQLRGFAWDDLDQNGLYDQGEPTIEGVTLWLMNTSDQVMKEIETEAAGVFLFDDINDGDYYIKANEPAGYEFTIKDFGIDDEIDSDFDADGNTDVFTFSGATVLRDVNVGFIALKKKRSSIYPNPVSGSELKVSAYAYEEGLSVSCKVLDHTGVAVNSQQLDENASKGYNDYSVDVSDVSEGLFVLKLQAGKNVEYIKFMKISE